METLVLWLLSALGGLMIWSLKLLLSVDNKLTGFESWKLAHDKQDDERHEMTQKNLEDLWANLNTKRR